MHPPAVSRRHQKRNIQLKLETSIPTRNRAECKTAETLYTDDLYQITCELDIALEIVQDNRKRLDEQLTHEP